MFNLAIARAAQLLWLPLLVACGPGSLESSEDLRRPVAIEAQPSVPADAQMLVSGDQATRSQSLQVRLPGAAKVRYCLEDADPVVERVTLQDAASVVVWDQRMSLLDGRPPCPEGIHLLAGTYTLTVQSRSNHSPSLQHPIFVYSPSDGTRNRIRSPGPHERWPLRFASTGQFLQAAEGGRPGADLQLLDPPAIVNLDEKTLFAPVTIVTPDGYEQLRIYSQRNLSFASADLKQPGRSMLNWDPETEALQLSVSADTTGLFLRTADSSPATSVVAYLRPLGAYRFAYCFYGQGFTKHHCLGTRGGAARLLKTLETPAVGNSLVSDDEQRDDRVVELVANPRYTTRPGEADLQVGEVMLTYTVPSQASKGERGALVYGESSTFVPKGWRPQQVWLGPDTEFSLDKGQTWLQASGPVALAPEQSVEGVQIRRMTWDMLVSSRSCRGCDLRTALGRRLQGLQLPGVDLSGASLTPRYGNILNAVNLTGALLRGVDLVGAIVLNGEMAGADLTGSNLRSSIFNAVNFEGSRLQGANMTAVWTTVRTRFSSRPGVRTVLDGAVLDGAQLDANLSNTPLTCVSLRWLRGSPEFGGSGMQCVDFSRSDLREARFDAATAWLGPSERPLPQNLRKQCAAGALESGPGVDGVFANLPCRSASLQNSTLRLATIPLEAWRKVDMSFARLEDQFGGDPYRSHSLAGLDFSGVAFDGFDWSGADLKSADFSGASLRAGKFESTRLVGARLPNTNISCLNDRCASFQAAELRGANFSNANLKGARFNGAIMNGAANATDPQLRAANMSFIYGLDANFDGVDLSGVNFSKAQLYGTRNSFARTTLVNTNFSGANLSQVDFSYAQIRGAIFTDANLVGSLFLAANIDASAAFMTSFVGASLHGADFSQAQAYGADFNRAAMPVSDGLLTVKVWNASRALVDKTFRYRATKPPMATDARTVCANGQSGPCAASQWTSNPTLSAPACIPFRRTLDFEDPLQSPVDQDFLFDCPWP